MSSATQIVVLDAGGQYCHLIARKVRDLGVYSEVRPSETPANELAGARGLIISGGPSSVYDSSSPTVDPAIFSGDARVLGICYGQQLMAHLLGGTVEKGEKGEYGLATLDLNGAAGSLFSGISGTQQIWMSHRDLVTAVPSGFSVSGTTATCAIAAIEAPARGLYGVQFHPEVAHTTRGRDILANFLFGICGCRRDWDPRDRVSQIEQEIRECVGDRNVFFFVSGGVDSTVACALCQRALGEDRVRGVYVDTGLMREGETDYVGSMPGVSVESAEEQFLGALAGVCDPEQKRHIIGEEFVRVQERIIESRHLLDDRWILGQGTIYPDTIESGGTQKAAVIKTHHNRVPGIQKLIDEKRLVEPLRSYDIYEPACQIGRELCILLDVLDRHPFPGPGLAIRCLCTESAGEVQATPEGYILPVKSVGVQGDNRSYAPVLCIDALDQSLASELVNRIEGAQTRRLLCIMNRPCRCRRHARPPQLPHARAHCPPAPRRRHRAPALARKRFRPAYLAVSRRPHSAGLGFGASIPSFFVPSIPSMA